MATVQQATPAELVGTTLVLTFPAPVTAGHCVVVALGALDSASSTFTAAPQLGSSPDNFFLHRQNRRTASGTTNYSAIWSDGDCAGGATTVTITLSGATGGFSTSMIGWAWEQDSISGHGAAIEDGTGAQGGSGTAWSSGSFTPNATTSGPGAVFGIVQLTGNPTITGPTSGWTNEAKQSTSLGNSAVAGFWVTTGPVTPVWSGTMSGAGTQWTAVGVALKSGSKAGVATPAGHGTLGAAAGIAGAGTPGGHGTLTAAASGAPPGSAPMIGSGTLAAAGSAIVQSGPATLAGTGQLQGAGDALNPLPVNQWAATLTQPSAFGYIPPADQSAEIPLTVATSVGGGSGIPSQGNWLFCAVGWRQMPGAGPVTISVQDDGHQWWRPGRPSNGTGTVRCAAWYQPNIGAVTGNPPAIVYVSPLGAVAALAVLIVEVEALGPWDQVYAVTTGYNAATRSLTISIGAP